MTRSNNKPYAKHQRAMIQRTLHETYARMELILRDIPDGCDLESNPTAMEAARKIWAIEEEWIIDPRLREELSLIQSYDDDDDDGSGNYV